MSTRGRKPILTEIKVLEKLNEAPNGLGFNELFEKLGKGSRSTLSFLLKRLDDMSAVEWSIAEKKYLITEIGQRMLEQEKRGKIEGELLARIRKDCEIDYFQILLNLLPPHSQTKWTLERRKPPRPKPLRAMAHVLIRKELGEFLNKCNPIESALIGRAQAILMMAAQEQGIKIDENITVSQFYQILKRAYEIAPEIMIYTWPLRSRRKQFDWNQAIELAQKRKTNSFFENLK
jgi:hypothetical protein